jgi:hypothetical protein
MKCNSWFVGVLGFVAVSASSGCSSESASEFDSLRTSTVRRYTGGGNGPETNGKGQNGKGQNGKSQNGKSQNGKSLQGLSVANSSESQNRSLVAVEMDTNRNMRGADFVDAELEGRLEDGTTQIVKVHAFDNTTVPGMDLFLVKYKDNGDPICGYKDGQPVWATVMSEIFDPSSGDEVANDGSLFTFGCRFYGIQKCQEYGYPKDKKTKERKNGNDKVRRYNDYHASCLRMVRADYCGDGIPHTYDGTLIDIYDHLLNNNAPATSTDGSDGWYKEAEWDSDGAHCINKTRWMPNTLTTLAQSQSSANPDWEYIRTHCPERFAYPVPKVGGGMSVPDRNCGTSSNFNTSVGFDSFAEDTATQTGRNKTANNSQLYRYTP